MVIYNVTTKVDHSIAADWLTWIKEIQIPGLIATGCFTNAVICHLSDADDAEGITYAVQYHAEDEQTYKRYIDEFANEMRKKSMDKWGNKFISFGTLMKVVN